MAKTTPQLPPSVVTRLTAAHEDRETQTLGLFALVVALRRAGWPLASISEPLGVSREIVRLWQLKAEAQASLPTISVPTPPTYISKATVSREESVLRQTARHAHEEAILADALPRLLALKGDAEALRGPSRFDPQKSAASRDYSELIAEVLDKGVRARVLAEALDVAEITVRARVRRAGLKKLAPTEVQPAWARYDYDVEQHKPVPRAVTA